MAALLPRDARGDASTRSRGLAIVVVLVATVIAVAFFRLHDARNAYMTLSNFHGWLECALLAFFFVRGDGATTAEKTRTGEAGEHATS